jgi:hypothetical protein
VSGGLEIGSIPAVKTNASLDRSDIAIVQKICSMIV